MRQSLAFDREAMRYDQSRGGELRGALFASALEPHLPRAGRLLDAGVGTGVVAQALAAPGRRVVGIDLSLPMLRIAAGRVPATLACADASRLPFAPESFEGAYSVWLLHLVADVGAVLAEVARVLTSGATYVVIAATPRGYEDPVSRAVWGLHAELGEERARAAGLENLRTLAPAVGFASVAEAGRVWVSYPELPADAAEKLVGRDYSWTWHLSDEEMESRVAPVAESLRALPPEPVEVRQYYDIFTLSRRG